MRKKDYNLKSEKHIINEQLQTNNLIKEAHTNMKKILSTTIIFSLDWDNATVFYKGNNNEEKIVTVKGLDDNQKILTYFIINEMRIYQWGNEVHALNNNDISYNYIK